LGGLVLVVFAGPARAKATSLLGVTLGLWTMAAGVMGVLVAVHGYDFPVTISGDNRFVFGVASAASLLLGFVVTVLAGRLLSSGPTTTEF
jgi:hypothetical protein